MPEQAMLARDLVLRVCASSTEFDRGWLKEGRKAVVPFDAARDRGLVDGIVAAGHAMGVDRLLVCRTRGEFAYEPVTQIEVRTSALLGLIRSWGREPTDFLVVVEDQSCAVLVTASRLTVVAGEVDFVRAVVGDDLAAARAEFAEHARASRESNLEDAAELYGCTKRGPAHARNRTPAPDSAERVVAGAAARRSSSPRRAALYRSTRGLLGWVALAVFVAGAVAIDELSMALPLTLGMLWLLVQLAWLARSRTLSFAALPRMMALGALCVVPVAMVERALAGVIPGLSYDDPYAYAYIAVPVEEVGKLAPVLLVWLFARRRFQRFAAVDYLLLAAASGAGFHLVEQVARHVSADGVLPAMPPELGLFTFLPGGVVLAEHGVHFSGHAVTTGLVGVACGIALVGWRRYGLGLWLLPPLALWIAALEHINVNAATIAVLQPKPATVVMYAAIGNGRWTPAILVLLILVAVILDYRVSHGAAQDVPPLPGEPPLGRAARWAYGRAIRLTVRVPGDIAPVFRRLALDWAWAPVVVVDTARRITHELIVQLAAARCGPSAQWDCWRFLRARREHAMGATRAGGRPWRRSPDSEDLTEQATSLTLRLGVATAAAALGAGVLLGGFEPLAGQGAAPAAYAAIATDTLAGFGSGLAGADQWWAVAMPVALLILLTSGWGLPHASPDPSALLRAPLRRTFSLLGQFAPGQIPYTTAALVGPVTPRRLTSLLRAPDRATTPSDHENHYP
ncbi:PrsW family intramembrane metalloprotease [Spiractinospora alimapuensis]|uniref:PrsW family glutamic-type intramembrane protease n=1 Tax=Spiractinospora alimapuensis TaxID=2820884 RepID=UPI001F2835C9|nr:PrsW family glutamic-type intramembrane protease [Spiractinospora alimapuensis]QVQ51085.1 PrsW family intramembrane metalloprotease [Spiractinospora alimapuensis]